MRSVSIICFMAFLVGVAGCATVDPGEDFAEAHRKIDGATGIDEAYHPDRGGVDEAAVRESLQDGLSLDEAKRLALRNNRELQAAFTSIGVAKADWVQSGLLQNPTLGMVVLFPEGGGRSFLEASIAQNLIELWQIPIRKEIRQRQLNAAILNVAHEAASLAQEVSAAYYRVVAAERELEIARENRKLLRKSRGIVTKQEEAGTASRFDRNLAQQEVNEAELKVSRRRLRLADARRRLAELLSLDRPASTLELTDKLPEAVARKWPSAKLVELARKRRLDLKAMEQAVVAAGGEVNLEKAKAIPEVAVGPKMERAARRGGSGDTIDELTGPTFTFELPIFDQNQAQVARSKYERLRDLKESEGLYIRVAHRVRRAADHMNTAAGNVSLYEEKLLPQARENLDLAERSYQAGQAEILELIETQRNLLDARSGYVDAQREAAAALAELERTAASPLDRLKQLDASANQQQPEPGKN